jgi:DNA-binding MarR family transcriptional regulator
VTLTGKGHALIDQALPDHVENEHRVLSALSASQRDKLAATLRDLLESLGDTTNGS